MSLALAPAALLALDRCPIILLALDLTGRLALGALKLPLGLAIAVLIGDVVVADRGASFVAVPLLPTQACISQVGRLVVHVNIGIHIDIGLLALGSFWRGTVLGDLARTFIALLHGRAFFVVHILDLLIIALRAALVVNGTVVMPAWVVVATRKILAL